MHRLLGCCALLVVGCATAVPANHGDGGGGDDDTDAARIDARVDALPIDAPIDAPAVQTITLTQTASMTIVPDNSVACIRTADLVTRENSYYRAFRLSDHGVTRPFTPTMVSFGVELADAAGAATTQPVQIRLHTLSGAMLTANLTNVAGNNVNVPDSATGTITPAPQVPPTAVLVAEIFVPDSVAVGHKFFPGTNTGTETQPGYVRAPTCTIPEPATYNSLAFPAVKLVLTVTGTF